MGIRFKTKYFMKFSYFYMIRYYSVKTFVGNETNLGSLIQILKFVKVSYLL